MPLYLVALALAASPVKTLPRLPPRPIVAVFPLTLKGAPADAIAEVELAIDRSLERLGNERRVQLLFGQALTASFKKKDPRTFVDRCKGEIACFADLARRVRAEEAVFGTLVVQAGNAELSLVLVKDRAVATSANIALARAGTNGTTLTNELSDFFRLSPLPPPAPPPIVVAPASAPASRPAAPLPAPLLIATAHTKPNPALIGVGIALLVTGAGAAATGGYFGIESVLARGSITSKTTQIDALSRNNTANTLAVRADILFAIGGGLGILGATFLGLGFKYAVSVAPGGALASVSAPW